MKKEDAIVYLEVEKSRIKRERAKIVLNKSLFLYVAFLIVGVFGFVNHYITSATLNMIIIMGIFVLVVGTLPYVLVAMNEDKKINKMIEDLKK
ncbi:MAG: hypothetical protein V1859_09445 [archaeon]